MGNDFDLGDNMLNVQALESDSIPDFVKARGYPVYLKLGMIHTLEITPVQYKETEKFGKLDVATRKCQTGHSEERRNKPPYRLFLICIFYEGYKDALPVPTVEYEQIAISSGCVSLKKRSCSSD